MKRLIVIKILILINYLPLICQNDSVYAEYKLTYKAIKINPLRSFSDEIPFFYEFGLNFKKALEIKAGIVYPNPLFRGWAVGFATSPRFYHTGIFLGIAKKTYRKTDEELFYISYSFTIKHKWFKDEDLWLGGMGGSSEANELYLSQKLLILNTQITIGNCDFKKNELNELYFGFGLNFIYAKTIYHGSRFSGYPNFCDPAEENEPIFNNGIYLMPTVHIGYKFGLIL